MLLLGVSRSLSLSPAHKTDEPERLFALRRGVCFLRRAAEDYARLVTSSDEAMARVSALFFFSYLLYFIFLLLAPAYIRTHTVRNAHRPRGACLSLALAMRLISIIYLYKTKTNSRVALHALRPTITPFRKSDESRCC